MPEEVNRVVTDSVSDALFVTEQSGMDNLKREGVADEKVHFVGNVMIDSLVGNLGRAGKRGLPDGFPFKNEPFALVTLHRPSNVDDAPRFGAILDAFEEIQTETGVVFPIHPRSLKRLGEFGLLDRIRGMKRVYVCEPLGYLDFLKLMTLAKFVITDSGGIQEETTFLGIPCMTLRENTERPVTVELGTNTLVPLDAKAIVDRARACLNGSKKGSIPPLWDGRASERIVEILGKWADGRTCR
jgi:UDP-N-acetylglucosamine 2-epimerase (non-hydrolysing)